MDNEKISVLVVEPEKKPYAKEISSGLSSLQHEVGGYIQAVYPWDDPVALVCDEEGLLKQYAFNRLVAPEVAIFGTCFICGLGEEDFADLPEAMIEKYAALLHTPQALVRTPMGVIAIPMDAEFAE